MSRVDRIAIYTRVSTTDQNRENQLPAIHEWIKKNGGKIVMEESDELSGTNIHRKGRQRIINACRHGKIDTIVVWSIDRWSRRAADLALTISELSKLDVRMVFAKNNYDTMSIEGRLLVHVLGAVGEFEREYLIERQREGIKTARAKGKHLGRKKNVIDEVEISRLKESGKSVREISEIMGIPKSTIYDRLKSFKQ